MLDLHKLFTDLFDPQPGETALVLIDTPHGTIHDTPAWEQRRAMAERWRAAPLGLGQQRGLTVSPVVSFPPTRALQAGRPVRLEALAEQATLILALTQFSASAPLIGWTRRFPRLRAASMPMVAPEMEATALAADYAQVARSCALLRDQLSAADFARV